MAYGIKEPSESSGLVPGTGLYIIGLTCPVEIRIADSKSFHEQWAGPTRGVPRHST